MSLRKSSEVWVSNRYFAWLPTEVLESSEKQVRVQTDSINKTYTGNILIVVNPFAKLPHLYNKHMMEQYRGAPWRPRSTCICMLPMHHIGRSQSILASGESGVGKTETTKLIMQYLTFVGGCAIFDYRTIEQQVLELAIHMTESIMVTISVMPISNPHLEQPT
ncbi:hypothetical protein P8452_43301 [Trifolium repens]|nr:hypothetical protein P8452_43301 [Trifolium repens]